MYDKRYFFCSAWTSNCSTNRPVNTSNRRLWLLIYSLTTPAALANVDNGMLEKMEVKRGHRKVLMEEIDLLLASLVPPSGSTVVPAQGVIAPPVNANNHRPSSSTYEVLHDGYLMKKGRGLRHAWKLRFFELVNEVKPSAAMFYATNQ